MENSNQTCVWELEPFKHIRVTHDHQNVVFFAVLVQEKVECVTCYNETNAVTETQRNHCKKHQRAPSSCNFVLGWTQHFSDLGDVKILSRSGRPSMTFKDEQRVVSVKIKPKIACCVFFAVIAWCDEVTVQPDNNNIKVFKKGISHGFKILIPLGGHIEPISTVGAKLLWKKAQKKAKKNSISDTIKKTIPNLKPCWTIPVWWPSKEDSLTTSRHHTNIESKRKIRLIQNKDLPFM